MFWKHSALHLSKHLYIWMIAAEALQHDWVWNLWDIEQAFVESDINLLDARVVGLVLIMARSYEGNARQ